MTILEPILQFLSLAYVVFPSFILIWVKKPYRLWASLLVTCAPIGYIMVKGAQLRVLQGDAAYPPTGPAGGYSFLQFTVFTVIVIGWLLAIVALGCKSLWLRIRKGSDRVI